MHVLTESNFVIKCMNKTYETINNGATMSGFFVPSSCNFTSFLYIFYFLLSLTTKTKMKSQQVHFNTYIYKFVFIFIKGDLFMAKFRQVLCSCCKSIITSF